MTAVIGMVNDDDAGDSAIGVKQSIRITNHHAGHVVCRGVSPTGWTASVVARLFPGGPEAARRGVAWLNHHLGSLVALGLPVGSEYVVDGGSAILSVPNHAQGSPWRLSPPVVHGLHDLVIRLGKIEGGQSQSLSATLGSEVLSCLVGFPHPPSRGGCFG
jgi:hypothetical protein